LPSAARRRLLQAGAALLGGAALAPSTAMTPAAPAAPAAPALPGVETGRLVRLADFASQHVAARHVDVWLPEGFAADGRHAVLYMHDGQMLYDARTTWNKQAWNVQTVAARLMAAGQIRPFIVVGVWNTGPTRFAEYFPQRFVDHLAPGPARDVLLQRAAMGPVRSDAYLRFLVEELKPAIDARFRPATGSGDTFIAGSSMGGLISLYALTEHPQVFGGAACLSTHWIGYFERNAEVPAAALAYLRQHLPPPGRHRLYMDRGTAELDALYDQAQERVDALMREKGFGAPTFDTRVFEGAGHHERAWAERLHIPLLHLLGR
jgi:enterochelin esterase-like enzyme